MIRRALFFSLLGVVASCGEEPSPGPEDAAFGSPAPRPNVLFIVWDTVRADRLQPYGYDRPTTPRLQELAKSSVVFERAVSGGMWTLPSHSTLFTGLPVKSHGVSAKRKWLDHHFSTLAERFQEAGYATYSFSANPFLSVTTNLVQGFETVEHPWDPIWQDAATEHTRSKFIPGDRSTNLSPDREDRDLSAVTLLKESGPVQARAFLEWQANQDRPFFAFLNYMEAHIPRIPSLESRQALMTPERIQASLELDQAHLELLAFLYGKREYSAEELDILNDVYDAAIRDLDKVTGQLFDEMRKLELLENTIVVLTSDHGENLGEHHLIGHKHSVHNTLLRVPLLIRAPGLSPQRVPEVVSTMDVPCTVLSLAGIDDPALGISKNLFRDPSTPAFAELVAITPLSLQRVSEIYPDLDWQPWVRTFRAVETDELKLILGSDGSRQLFRIQDDPGELHDLAETAATQASGLEHTITRWSQSIPPYDPDKASEDDTAPEFSEELEERLRALGYFESGD